MTSANAERERSQSPAKQKQGNVLSTIQFGGTENLFNRAIELSQRQCKRTRAEQHAQSSSLQQRTLERHCEDSLSGCVYAADIEASWFRRADLRQQPPSHARRSQCSVLQRQAESMSNSKQTIASHTQTIATTHNRLLTATIDCFRPQSIAPQPQWKRAKHTGAQETSRNTH